MIVAVPKVSVITVNLNMCDALQMTVANVLAQSYRELEYLVIDGGSSDGSVDVLARNDSQISHWVSEPDRGLYHAMNKGVQLATGDWVIFMNSGDRFYDTEVVADIFREPHSDADLVYGHSVQWHARERVGRVRHAESPAVLPLRTITSHQSVFCRRHLLLERPFSENIMVADYEFFVHMRLEGRRFKIIDRIVGVNVDGGISDLTRIRSVYQGICISVRNGLMKPYHVFSYAGLIGRAVMVSCVKRVLPVSLAGWLLRRRTIRGAS